MYKLAERPGDSAGVYCGAGGLFLGRSPLIARIGATYRIRVDDEIAGLLAAAYGSIEEAERLRPRLRLIRSALQDGDHCRAMILAVQARLGPVAAEGIARLAQTESLCKYTSIPTSRATRTAAGHRQRTGPRRAGPASLLIPHRRRPNIRLTGVTKIPRRLHKMLHLIFRPTPGRECNSAA
ncbi:MAG TPA: hypothetical protein VGP52_02045 [Stellaceae bacterium]|jgi:hypothetical protein|nr:hypothetical protein [Stellaceae bacterium]